MFFASYVFRPTDRAMQLPTTGGLVRRERLDGPSTVVARGSRELVTRPDWKEGWLRRDDRIDLHANYFVGHTDGMAYQVMVEPDTEERVCGFAAPRPIPDDSGEPPDNQPWDFHLTFFDVEPDQSYSFRASAAYARDADLDPAVIYNQSVSRW